MEDEPRRGPGWRRAAGLLAISLMLSVSSVSALVAIPLVALAVMLGARRLGALAATAMAVAIAFGGVQRDSVWYLERGWALLLGGWFVALTLGWPSARFFPRALVAVVGTFAMVGLFFGARPGDWAQVDWLVSQRITESVTMALDVVRALQGHESQLSGALVATVYQTAEQQGRAFPALLGLSSLSALGVAWWCYVRLAWGSDRGVGPLREFRFNDQLVWLFIAGLIMLVLGLGEGAERAGSNTVVFMGGLYALRGAAVVAFFNGGVSFFGMLLLVMAVIFLGPFLLMGTLLIGLGDTWLDFRSRVEALVGNDEGRGG